MRAASTLVRPTQVGAEAAPHGPDPVTPVSDSVVAGPRAEPRLAALGLGELPSQAAPRMTAPARPDREDPRERLARLVASVDLSHPPSLDAVRGLAAGQAVDALVPGDWVVLRSRADESVLARVAWINERRSVVLLVQASDRRALSLRMAELRARFDQGRARLLGS